MKPVKKMNLMHQQILGDLRANKPTTRVEERVKKSGRTYKTHEVVVETSRLAGNVSEVNIDRAARRWSP